MLHSASDFILNFDSSAYHIALLPQDICPYVITVGDPKRINLFKPYFSSGFKEIQKREFHSIAGSISGHRVLVISTGIGPDNIDIVFNEIRGLHLMAIEEQMMDDGPLKIIRMGTSGSIDPAIELNDILISKAAIGLDNLPCFYDSTKGVEYLPIMDRISPYKIEGSATLYSSFIDEFKVGLTLTCPGFYGPQFREVFLKSKFNLDYIIQHFQTMSLRLTNMEMETAAIYYFAQQFGYEAISISSILAHRLNNEFSNRADYVVQDMVDRSLSLLF